MVTNSSRKPGIEDTINLPKAMSQAAPCIILIFFNLYINKYGLYYAFQIPMLFFGDSFASTGYQLSTISTSSSSQTLW